MATATETVELRYRANLEELTKNLSRLDGITADEARKAVKELDKSLRLAERAAKRAASNSEKEWTKRLGDIKRGGSAVFGGMVGDIEDIGGALKAIGPAGAAVVGTLGAMVGVSYGAYKLAEGMFSVSYGLRDANRELSDIYSMGLPGFTQASQEAIDASERLHGQVETLTDVGTQLRVEVGEKLAPSMADATGELVQIGVAALDGIDRVGRLAEKFNILDGGLGRIVAKQALLGPLFSALGVATEGYSEEVDLLAKREGIRTKVEEVNKPLQEKAVELTKKRTEAIREQTRAEKEREQATLASIRADQELFNAGNDPWEEDIAKMQTLGKMLTDVENRHAEGAAAITLQYDAQIERAKELGATEDQIGILIRARQEDIAKFEQEQADKKKERDEQDAARTASMLQQELDDKLAVGSQLAAAAETFFADQVAGSQMVTEQQKKQALALFRAQQLAALSEIGFNTASAVMKGYAMFGPPPSPFGTAAALAAAAAGAVQAGIVMKQKPPTGHTGLGPDRNVGERDVRMLDTEAVLSAPAVRRLGGRRGVAATNAGTAGTGGPLYIAQVLGHRVFDVFSQEVLDQPSNLRRAVNDGRARSVFTGSITPHRGAL